MGKDRLLVASSERVDLADFDFAVNTGLNDAMQHMGAEFLTDAADERAWVLRGFETSNPSGTQIQVTRGSGILSRREDGVLSHGMVTSEGDAIKIIDVAAFTTSVVYTVYIRFQYADGNLQGRSFWDSSSSQEFTQTVATRRVAGWSMRIEASNPGAEWLPVATFTLAGGPTVTNLADTRPLYFEGKVNDTYASGWSTDSDDDSTIDELPTIALTTDPAWPGGAAGAGVTAVVTTADTSQVAVGDFAREDADGRWFKVTVVVPSTSFTVEDVHAHGGTFPSATAISSIQTDRGTNRETDGVHDLQRFTASVRQCLEDLKGRGLRRWWDREIAGMNVGFDADPSEDILAVGDVGFRMDLDILSTKPYLVFQDSPRSAINYDRATDIFAVEVLGAEEVTINAAGLTVVNGLSVGHTTAPTNDVVSVGDTDFNMNLVFAGQPSIVFDTDDSIVFDRTASEWRFTVATTIETYIDSAGIRVANGLSVGHIVAPVDDTISVGDAAFVMALVGDIPTFEFDTNDAVTYNRTNDWFIGVFNNTTSFVFSDTRRPVIQIYNPDINTTRVNPEAYTVFPTATITIPSAEVAVGQLYRVRAGGDIRVYSVANGQLFSIALGSTLLNTAVMASTNTSHRNHNTVDVRINTIAASGSVSVFGVTFVEETTNTTALRVDRLTSTTNGDLVFSFQGRIIAGDGNDEIGCTFFSVERVH